MIWQDIKSLIKSPKKDGPFSLYMFLYFFLIIVTFWIYKPIKKTIFVHFYDQTGLTLWGHLFTASQAELLAKVINLIAAAIGMYAFTLLSRKFRRGRLSLILISFFITFDFVFAFLLESGVTGPLAWGLYVFGDFFVMVMVAAFFAFLNDSVNSEQAKKIYGLVILGGILGGVVGTTVVRTMIGDFAHFHWLLICAGVGFLLLFIVNRAGKIISTNDSESGSFAKENAEGSGEFSKSDQSWMASAKSVFANKYLLSLASIVMIYEIVSQVLDFQFTATISHYLNGDSIGRHFATVYSLTNLISCFVQIAITPWLLKKGVRYSLTVFPALVLLVSGGFLFMPLLWIGSALSMVDNAINYSLNQSARESLYVPLSRKQKYEVKAFIDIFVARFAKVLAIGVSLIVTMVFTGFETIHWLSVAILPLAVIWFLLARYLGGVCDGKRS